MKPVTRFLLSLVLTVALTNAAVSGDAVKTTAFEGQVIDSNNKDGLAGVAVTLVKGEEAVVVYSDFEGHFNFSEVPYGTYEVRLSLVSYEELVIKSFEIGKEASGFTLELQSR